MPITPRAIVLGSGTDVKLKLCKFLITAAWLAAVGVPLYAVMMLEGSPKPVTLKAADSLQLAAALAAAETHGVRGKDVTPFLLDFFHRETRGASLAANVALVLSNARLAAEVAAAYVTDEATGEVTW